MRIKGVDFPEALLDAQEKGELVIFAGAGVSVPPPSNYPNFDELAEQVSQGALERGKDNAGKYVEPVDVFLGRLVDKKIKVHEKVRKILLDPNSAPNPLHSGLLGLFKRGSVVRLVTTNFDVHFTTAAKLLSSSNLPEIFSAPALPPGDPLQGIVHLHGSVDKPADRLILTDSDFGRAYLTQGWATRFLQDLFARYVILFVGYSHRDLVMNYLARGLPSKTHGPGRFALTPEGPTEHWTSLGITPLFYPIGGGGNKHAALGQMLAAWADLVHREVLDHERQIKSIVTRPVPFGGEELEYLDRMLKDPSTAQFFVRHAKNVDWLRWVESKPCFTKLFDGSFDVGPVERALAWWFAQEFACNHPAEALAVVRRRGETLGPVLSVALGQAFHVSRPSPENLGKWIPLIIKSSNPRLRDDFLHYLLHQSRYPEDSATALLLFAHLTKPAVALKQDLWSLANGDAEEKADFELETEGQDFWLRGTWNIFFQPNLEVFAERLALLVTSHLEDAHSLLEACGKIHPTWDPISLSRDSIEFGGGGPTNATDLLVDIARDVLLWNIDHMPARADALIDSWWSSRSRILKRLAIFGVSKNSRWVGDRKANWLLENNLLYTAGLKAETSLLLEAGYKSASKPTRSAILEAIASGPSSDLEENHRDRETFNLFCRATQAAPDCPLARARLEELVKRHPEWAQRERGEQASPWEGDRLRSPIQAAELLAKVPEEWIERLVSYTPQNLREPSREGLLEQLSEALRQNFDWSLELACALSSAASWQSDLWRPIVGEWGRRDLADLEWEKVLHFLSENGDAIGSALYESCYLLENGSKKAPHGIPKSATSSALQAAETIWNLCVESLRPRREELEDPFGNRNEVEDWLTRALNNPSGMLMEFWLRTLLSDKQPADTPKTILEPYRRLFSDIAQGGSYAAELARVLLASQIHALFSLDEEWTVENLIPLLRWSTDPRRAIQAWHGFLWWGRWTEALLPHLMPQFEESFPALHANFGKHREKFCAFLAGIACFSTLNPREDGWLRRFLKEITLEERVMWAWSILPMLKEMKPPAIPVTWNAWMRDYWQDRLDGIPAALDAKEMGPMLHWLVNLGPAFEEGVGKFCQGPAPEVNNTARHFYYELLQTDLPNNSPAAMTRLLAFLLENSVASYWEFDEIDKLVRKIPVTSSNRCELISICNSLARLGHPGATSLQESINKAGAA